MMQIYVLWLALVGHFLSNFMQNVANMQGKVLQTNKKRSIANIAMLLMFNLRFYLYLISRFNFPILCEVVYLEKFLVFYLVFFCDFFQCVALLDDVGAFV